MIARTGYGFDIILITGEYYDDHPSSPVGVIARVLDAKGFRVGILERPKTKEEFMRLGTPTLFFGVTSGSIDSMINNYTPLKKPREEDDYNSVNKMPDRAVIFYCNKIKEYFKQSKIVIGGIEASLRRFAHYDYWDNKVRRSILYESRANILVYGNGEKQVLEIARRIKSGKDIFGIEGTCVISKELPPSFEQIPSFKEAATNRVAFCKMQLMFSNRKNLAQFYDNNYLLQFSYPNYTSQDLDWIYSLDYSRKLHPKSLLGLAKFSVVTHRGCIGKCNFCSISLHQGDKIISRSKGNIIREIQKLTLHPEFKGFIDDLGGPSANMYGMDCSTPCGNDCISCQTLDRSHSKLIDLLRAARAVKGVKKVFIRSGIRFDLASKEYIQEISQHHISGLLKIAPEHVSPKVLQLMNKRTENFEQFVEYFNSINKGQFLRYYFMVCHPGEDYQEFTLLKAKLQGLKNFEQFQLFTPTPMTVSTCMYWTGFNPYTMEKVPVVYEYGTKKDRVRELDRLIKKR